MLFEPVAVGSMLLKNRIVMPALHHAYTPEGLVNERLIRYYERRAQGGAALIVIGGCSVDPAGTGPAMIGLHDDSFLEGLTRLAAAVKSAGARAAVQLYHAGRYTHSMLTGLQPLAPSAIPSRLTRETPREMSREDIAGVVEKFATAAHRAREAGFDAVEIIASAGYLICQFLSPVTNRRTDEYGGSWENRCRFGAEVASAVRERIGPDIPVMVRLSGHDFIPGSSTNSEAAAFAAVLEKAGADCFNVTGGWHETRVPQITGDLPPGGFTYLAAGVKAAVNVPVIASNRINDPRTAEEILRNGQADLVNLGRALVADPDFPLKARAGEHRSIRRCLACNQGCLDSIFSFQELHCAVNPLAGREHEIAVTPAAKPRRILVVGGGPGGSETALTAARRGHQVTLWEKEERLGGQLRYAAQPPGKQEFATLAEYYSHQLPAAGVEICLKREAKAADILEFAADIVIVATGSRPADPPFPVKAPGKVLTALEALDASAPLGKRVVVVGGGAVGCETALAIAERGTLDAGTLKFLLQNGAETPENLLRLVNRGPRDVTILEMAKGVGRDIGVSTRWVVLQNLRRLGVRVVDRATVREVAAAGVSYEKDGQVEFIPADTVVLAVGAQPERSLAEELEGKVAELHVIGDAVKPRKVTEAVREGFDLALTL